MTDSFNTYAGWLAEGRAVLIGQKANFYDHYEDGYSDAIFHYDQTEEHLQRDRSGATQVTAEEHRESKTSSSRPRLRLDLSEKPQGIELAFWCGSSKTGIKFLQKNGFRFMGARHRWIAIRQQDKVEKIVEALTKSKFDLEIVNNKTSLDLTRFVPNIPDLKI